MATYKEIIRSTGEAINKCDLAELLNKTWKNIEWVANKEAQTGSDAALCASGDMCINLYPLLQDMEKPETAVLVEFGKLILQRSGENGQAIWAKKMDVPTKEAIDMAAKMLADPNVRAKCKEFKDVLDEYPRVGHSVERLVYINIVNALLANNISFGDSVGVNIREWGPTAEYCNQRKYHSLIPLVSAYSPADVYADFGSALSAMVQGNLTSVRDRSVAFALRGIIQRIVKLATREN